MRFLNALLALPLIGAVLGKPVPAKQEDKRLLGLENLVGGSPSSGSSTDLGSLLDQMNSDLEPNFDILYGVRGGSNAQIVEAALNNIKGTLVVVTDTIRNNFPAGKTGSPQDAANKLKPFLGKMSGSLNGLPEETKEVPGVADLIGAVEAYAGSLVLLLKWLFGSGLEDAFKGAPPALAGTFGGILSNLLSLGQA